MKLVTLNYENGEKFIQQFRKLLAEKDIVLCAVDKRKRKLKKKDRYNRHAQMVHRLFEGSRDGIWRPSNHRDTTCTNMCMLSETYFRLGLRIDLSDTSHVNGVKWTWQKMKKWDKKNFKYVRDYTSFHLNRKSLEKKLFPKIKKVLHAMGVVVDKIECESLGGMHKDIYVEVTCSDLVAYRAYQKECEEREKQRQIEQAQIEKEMDEFLAKHPQYSREDFTIQLPEEEPAA